MVSSEYSVLYVFQSVSLIDDGPDMIIIKDETFEDCSGNSKLQSDLKRNEKGVLNENGKNNRVTAEVSDYNLLLSFA